MRVPCQRCLPRDLTTNAGTAAHRAAEAAMEGLRPLRQEVSELATESTLANSDSAGALCDHGLRRCRSGSGCVGHETAAAAAGCLSGGGRCWCCEYHGYDCAACVVRDPGCALYAFRPQGFACACHGWGCDHVGDSRHCGRRSHGCGGDYDRGYHLSFGWHAHDGNGRARRGAPSRRWPRPEVPPRITKASCVRSAR